LQNSQYTYYGAGLLSEVDRFPAHQNYIVGQYGYGSEPVGQTLFLKSPLEVCFTGGKMWSAAVGNWNRRRFGQYYI
jgi:hypothetical protein